MPLPVPVKRHRGERAGTHTRDTRAHTGTRITQTNLTTIQTQRHTRTTTRRPKPRSTQQPQARRRPLPAADSEEAAPSEPDPASTRSQSASPRLLEGIPVKSHWGSRDSHGTHGTHGHTDHTGEPHNHPDPQTHTRDPATSPGADRGTPRPTQERPPPANPTRRPRPCRLLLPVSQSASPGLLESGRHR